MTGFKKSLALALALSTIGAPYTAVRADATTATASIAVSATVLSLCTVAALPLAFGNYSAGANSDASTSVTVICTNGTSYNVGLDNGTTTGATTAARLMAGTGSNTLTYSLFKDSGRSTVWGNTIGTNTTTGTGNGLTQTLTVFGRAPSGQFVAPGAYTDTVTVTLTY